MPTKPSTTNRTTMITLRVPNEVAAALKARAEIAGLSLTAYLLARLHNDANTVTYPSGRGIGPKARTEPIVAKVLPGPAPTDFPKRDASKPAKGKK